MGDHVVEWMSNHAIMHNFLRCTFDHCTFYEMCSCSIPWSCIPFNRHTAKCDIAWCISLIHAPTPPSFPTHRVAMFRVLESAKTADRIHTWYQVSFPVVYNHTDIIHMVVNWSGHCNHFHIHTTCCTSLKAQFILLAFEFGIRTHWLSFCNILLCMQLNSALIIWQLL